MRFIFSISILLLFISGLFLINPIRILISDVIYDNKEIFDISCSELPSMEEVRSLLEKHKHIVDTIISISPDSILVSESPKPSCPNKGYVEISYGSHDQRMQIEKIIGDKFFGIPWRGINH